MELAHLLAKIAGEVRQSNAVDLNFKGGEKDGTSKAIASLSKSLNSDDNSSSGIRVCSARIERLIDTMISVLYSSASCKISRLGREGPELLQVGSSISFGDCDEIMRMVADVLESLEANKGFVHDLLHAVLRTAVSSSVWPSICDRGIEITGISRTANSRLMHILCDKIYPSSHETPLRLFFWYLDPLLLKNDISEVLREIMQRPFLSLKEEFYNRPTWRRIISCLATSPSMFRQASTLLHSWFLMTYQFLQQRISSFQNST
ncbi:hypothetical protein KFK09_026207 [Dendrobium nobile]|uniref:Uncharacterized protein n=1 Tax=Dendrobium nobile TaxID=94219 RepID=A0A8T3A7J0_DENNO|nr:hypothetical protein KFK09_026207 [Dendrobium nobile]